MIETLILVGVAGYFLFGAVRRLIMNRFPHPIDLTILSTFYYAVPLVLAALFVFKTRIPIFLTEAASDPELARDVMRLVVTAMISLVAGRYLAKLLGPAKIQFWLPLSSGRVQTARIWFFVFGGLIAAGVVLFGWREFIAGYATESETPSAALGNGLVFFAIEAFGMLFAYCLLVKLSTGKLPHAQFIVVAALVILFVLGARQKRLEVLSSILPVAIILLSKRRKISNVTLRIVGALGAGSLLILIAAVRLSDELSLSSAMFYGFAEGIYAGHALPGILLRLDLHLVDYEYGARVLNGFLGFIPRLVWPGKDDLLFAGNLALDGVSPLGATSFLAEVVLQGGFVAVIVIYATMGFFFERLMHFQEPWDRALSRGMIPMRFGLYLVIVAIVVPHYRDGMIPSIKLGLQDTLVFFLVAGLRPVRDTLLARRQPGT
jgi:hypothetical protein